MSVAGGGDTVAALNQAQVAGDFSYVSTAGGAFLEWMEGKPLPGVEVRFAPECDPNALSFPFSRALTDDNGHYRLECDNKAAGAVPGKHTVIVRRPIRRPSPDEPAPPPVGPPIPAIYQSFGTTPIVVEVKFDNRVYDLNLKSKAK